MMVLSVIFHEQAGYIHSVYGGELDMPGIREVIDAVGLAVKAHNCYRVLNDFTKCTLTASITDIYDLPKLIVRRGRELDVSVYKIKRALVIPAAAYENFRFFETVSLNNSQTVKIFTEEQPARDWLLAK